MGSTPSTQSKNLKDLLVCPKTDRVHRATLFQILDRVSLNVSLKQMLSDNWLDPIQVIAALYSTQIGWTITEEFTLLLFQSRSLRQAISTPRIQGSLRRYTVFEWGLKFLDVETEDSLLVIVTDRQLRQLIPWERIASQLWEDRLSPRYEDRWVYEPNWLALVQRPSLARAICASCPAKFLAELAVPYVCRSPSKALIQSIVIRATPDGLLLDDTGFIYSISEAIGPLSDLGYSDAGSSAQFTNCRYRVTAQIISPSYLSGIRVLQNVIVEYLYSPHPCEKK
jgi:hypothetical protein